MAGRDGERAPKRRRYTRQNRTWNLDESSFHERICLTTNQAGQINCEFTFRTSIQSDWIKVIKKLAEVGHVSAGEICIRIAGNVVDPRSRIYQLPPWYFNPRYQVVNAPYARALYMNEACFSYTIEKAGSFSYPSEQFWLRICWVLAHSDKESTSGSLLMAIENALSSKVFKQKLFTTFY